MREPTFLGRRWSGSHAWLDIFLLVMYYGVLPDIGIHFLDSSRYIQSEYFTSSVSLSAAYFAPS